MIKLTMIAGIGCNHMGDINAAKEFINITKDFCKVNVVKFSEENGDRAAHFREI